MNKIGIFDECMQTFPGIKPPADFNEFWRKSLDELKKVPVSPKQKLHIKRSIGREIHSDVTFNGFGNYQLKGRLTVPRGRKKCPAVITVHDYLTDFSENREFRELGLAHLSLFLRHHEGGRPTPEKKEETPIERHIFQSGLNPVEGSYIFLTILDVIRAVDFLRLQNMIDSSRIGIIGRGIGGAAAAFAAVFKKNNIKALVIENMGYVWYPRWIEESTSSGRAEIAEILNDVGMQKNRVRLKKNLEYVDPLYISEEIAIPVMFSANLKDSINPPVPAFSFFNHLRTEKIAQIYPELNSDPDMSKQRQKSIEFISSALLQKTK